MVFFVSGDKSIQTLRIYQFAGITAKMGKNSAVDEAVVGKIKRNMICSRRVVHVIGACHKFRINFKWSNDTTTEEKVKGVHKDGLTGGRGESCHRGGQSPAIGEERVLLPGWRESPTALEERVLLPRRRVLLPRRRENPIVGERRESCRWRGERVVPPGRRVLPPWRRESPAAVEVEPAIG